MNKFKYYFILIITTLFLFSCSKDDDTVETVPLRDYAEQFAADNAAIEEYLKTYYITVTNNPGEPDDQDVKIEKITVADPKPSIWSYLNSATFPKLLSREVKLHDITYTMYYLVLREGVGESPCNVDGIFAAYKGTLLDNTVFDSSVSKHKIFNLDGSGVNGVFVRGWKEIFPQFKAGAYSEHLVNGEPDGTLDYGGFGAGMMFIPSGLAYYASSSGFPSYSPLVFSFKLYDIQRLDHDADGIPSYLEDIDGDGYVNFLATGVENPDDTDKDGVPDFGDIDDDGDRYLTKNEIKNPVTGLPYSYDLIPTCTSGKKNYLDSTCHP